MLNTINDLMGKTLIKISQNILKKGENTKPILTSSLKIILSN